MMEAETEYTVGRTLFSTNSSSQLKSPGYTAFFVILTLLACAAVLLNVLTITALIRDSTILKTMRALLVNILVAELLTSAAIIMDTTTSAILSASVTNYSTPPPQQFCRFVNWVFAASVIARMYGLAAYTVIVIVHIKCGWTNLRTIYLAFSIVALWTAAVVLGVDRWIPQSVDAVYLQDVTCSSVAHKGVILSVRLTFGILWIILGGFLPTIVCFALTMAAICQLWNHKMQNTAAIARYQKSVAKLASFLIIGNVVNLFCTCLPSLGSIISSFPQTQVDSVAVVTIFFTALTLSLFPTHIIVMIFMKTVRQQMTAIICHCQFCYRRRKKVTEELEMKGVPLLVEGKVTVLAHSLQCDAFGTL